MKRELDIARGHIKFCADIYRVQLRAGRHFVHEHPEGSRAWSMAELQEIMMHPRVGSTVLHMCSFGMVAEDEKGVAPVKKGTRVMSSSTEVLKRVARRCENETEKGHHRHVHLIQGRAKAAQVYPRAFSENICDGIAAQKKLEGSWNGES